MTPSATSPVPEALTVRPSPLADRTYGRPRCHADAELSGLAFAADGTFWSIDDAGVLRHWDAEGSPLSRTYLSDLETLWAFSPGADRLASGNDDLLFWDVRGGKLQNRIEQPSWVTALGFSPNGAVLASGHDDGTVRLWDARTQTPIKQIKAHPEAVSSVAFAPGGNLLATAGEDRIVRVWDANTLAQQGEYRSHTDRIPALAWAPNGGLFASAGWDTSARVWKPGTPDPVILLNSHSDQVVTLAFAPVGTVLATADSDFDVHLWSDPAAGKVRHVLRGHADEIKCLAFSPDGSRLITGGADRVIHLWDTKTGVLLAGPNPKGKHGLAVAAGGTDLFVVSSGAADLRAWDAGTAKDFPLSNAGPVHCVAASADGRYVAAGGTDHYTRLLDRTTGTIKLLEATKPPIGALSFSADGTKLAQASPADGLVWIWTTATGEPEIILIEAADGCTLESVAYLPDGRHVAVGGIDVMSTGDRSGAVCVWNVAEKKKTHVFDYGVYAVAADPTGRYVAGTGINDAVYLWDLQQSDSEPPVFELSGHQGVVPAVAFSPDGNYLLSGGTDQTVRVWDVLSGRLLVVREFDSAILGLAFSPDGKWLFTGNADTTVSRLPFEQLLDE